VATDLREGDSFNSSFLHRSFLDLTVNKNFEYWSTFTKVIEKIKVAYSCLRHGIVTPRASEAAA